MELMGHIPGIAVRNHDLRLGEELLEFGKRVYDSSACDPGLARPCERLKSFNVDPSGKVLAVTKQNRGAQRGIVVILVIGFGQFFESFRINAVLDVRTVDAKKDDLSAPLDGQLCSGTEGYVLKRCGWGVRW